MADFMSFNEFLDRTAGARVEYHRETIAAGLVHPFAAARGFLHEAGAKLFSAALKKIKDETIEEEFEKMKKHVLSLYKGVKNVSPQNTFVGPGGSFIDCVAVEDQPSCQSANKAGHKLKTQAPKPPRLAAPKSNGLDFGPLVSPVLPPLRRGLVDVFGKPMACPAGRIPMRRITIAQLAQQGKFENLFRKYPARPDDSSGTKVPKIKKASQSKKKTQPGAPVVPPPFAGTFGGINATEIHRHAVCNAANSNTILGCSTWLNLWNVDPAPGQFNLSQLWLIGTNGAGVAQTIESGWQRRQFPDMPVLFIFHTKHNYFPDPNFSGYFPTVSGFRQTNPDWIIDTGLSLPMSAPNEDQTGLQMLWQIADDGAWWLYLGNGDEPPTPLGNFPPGFFDGSFTNSAQQVQFGGEVCSQGPRDPSYAATGSMGSGGSPTGTPSADFKAVAFQRQIGVKLEARGKLVPADLQVLGADANYSVTPQNSSDPSWGSFLFYGGPNGFGGPNG